MKTLRGNVKYRGRKSVHNEIPTVLTRSEK